MVNTADGLLIYLIYRGNKGICDTVADILENFAETELTKKKLVQYSKARPLFRSEEGEKVKAFQKSQKGVFQVLDIVHTKHLKSEEISLLEEILQR